MESLGEEVNGLAILVDDIPSEVFYLEIDGTQLNDWSAYLDEAIVANNLPPPLHFRRTLDNIQVGHDLPVYPPVPDDWYHGPTDLVHVPPTDWKEINIASPGEEPKNIKMGFQFSAKEIVEYSKLLWEFREVSRFKGNSSKDYGIQDSSNTRCQNHLTEGATDESSEAVSSQDRINPIASGKIHSTNRDYGLGITYGLN